MTVTVRLSDTDFTVSALYQAKCRCGWNSRKFKWRKPSRNGRRLHPEWTFTGFQNRIEEALADHRMDCNRQVTSRLDLISVCRYCGTSLSGADWDALRDISGRHIDSVACVERALGEEHDQALVQRTVAETETADPHP